MSEEEKNQTENQTEDEEKKTRQRLTVTAMYQAIYDIEQALGPSGNYSMRTISLTTTKKAAGLMYVATLYRGMEGSDEKPVCVAAAESLVDFEEAVAQLLTQVRDRFEEHRKKLLAGIDAVLDKHHGALRGARSKIREKK